MTAAKGSVPWWTTCPGSGELLLGRYTAATTSGTTESHGDDGPNARLAARAHRGRLALVIPTGGHFAITTAAARITNPRLARIIGALSVHDPLPEKEY